MIQSASQVVETVIYEMRHQTLEQILVLSAEQLAGARTPGKVSAEIRHHGSQAGRVQLADRKMEDESETASAPPQKPRAK